MSLRIRQALVASACLALIGCSFLRPPTPPADEGWPSYNGSLSSQRFFAAAAIDRRNVARLTATCVFDLGLDTSFQTGPLVIGNTLYGTTEKETFAMDAANCQPRWRIREQVEDSILKTNRGLAFLDGRLFRGLQDGRVVAYEAATGRKLWETRIADPRRGESVPAAPIAWNGMVFIGQAGGDNYAVKGRMYALDAATGQQLWQTGLVPRDEDRPSSSEMARIALPTWRNPPNIPIGGGATSASYSLDPERGLLYVPTGNPAPAFVISLRPGENLFTNSIVVLDARTGAYRQHFSVVPNDFHNWDVSAPPALVTTSGGRRLMAVAPKDGRLYGYDLGDAAQLYATPVTTIENDRTPLTEAGTRFCPGSQGGSEWNGPAYNPQLNLIYTGSVDWCTTVQIAPPERVAATRPGQPWTGTPGGDFGRFDPRERWGGWITATDADSGAVRWRFRTEAPVLAAVTPTAGGVVFSADMAGNAYALDARNGAVLWRTRLEGAAGGGIITYVVGGRQYVAFVAGSNSPIWPVDRKSAKVVVYSLSGSATPAY
jgi:alcohol dehydrogenase (cytochrome c)